MTAPQRAGTVVDIVAQSELQACAENRICLVAGDSRVFELIDQAAIQFKTMR
jgi:hypothetical protein